MYANTAAARGTTSVSNTMLLTTASSVDHYSNSDMHALIKAQVNLLTCQCTKIVYDVPYVERNTKCKLFVILQYTYAIHSHNVLRIRILVLLVTFQIEIAI